MQFDFNANFFELFGLAPAFALDAEALRATYRQLQSQVHPDRFAHLSDQERRLSLQWATRVNEAFETLKSPVNRGRYLLSLRGVDTQEETNTAMPMDFLMQQMEWREAIADARTGKDIDALDRLLRELGGAVREEETLLAAAIDRDRQYDAAAVSVRKLRFLEKLRAEINQSIEALEG